jgi:hypothetical protein
MKTPAYERKYTYECTDCHELRCTEHEFCDECGEPLCNECAHVPMGGEELFCESCFLTYGDVRREVAIQHHELVSSFMLLHDATMQRLSEAA